MDIALLNERVTFQKNGVTVDRIGNHINGWTDFYSCAATISGESGTESAGAGGTQDHTDMAVTIRWCRKASEITMTGFRLIFHGDIYDIVSVDHMNYKKKCLKFRCRKEQRSG